MEREVILIQTLDQNYFRPENDFWSNCYNKSAYNEFPEPGTEAKVEESLQFSLIYMKGKIIEMVQIDLWQKRCS